MLHAPGDITKHLVHAGEFKDHLSSRLEDSFPLGENVKSLPLVKVFKDMNGGDGIGGIGSNFQPSKITLEIRYVRMEVNIYPSVPFLASAAEVVGRLIAFLNAAVTICGENVSVT